MWNRFHKYGLAFLVFVVSASCGRTPEGVLSEKKMKEVTIDMKLAEAMIESDYSKYQEYTQREALFQSVFDKHKITAAVYDSSLIWYGKNLDIYMDIFEQADKEIDQRIKGMGDTRPDMEAISAQRDSVDIWPLRKFYVFPSSGGSCLIAFDLKPETPYMAGSVFVLGADFWGIPSRLERAPELKISVEQSDTTITVYKPITKDGYVETEIRTIQSQQVRRVYGYIRLLSNDPLDTKIYVDKLNLFKYAFGYSRTLNREAEIAP